MIAGQGGSLSAVDNAKIHLTRLLVHLTPFLKIIDDISLGIVIITQFSTRLKGDGFIPDVSCTNKVSPRFEFGYKWISLTYVYTLGKNKIQNS
ncbi:MAG: hypothetical protein CUR34_11565 [Sediminibacterium sp.]|nr:MAG: hypothetical protein CUR34_11565 [Sediminibacterium sp.] [Sediminibacterium sp. FEMGT703S]